MDLGNFESLIVIGYTLWRWWTDYKKEKRSTGGTDKRNTKR